MNTSVLKLFDHAIFDFHLNYTSVVWDQKKELTILLIFVTGESHQNY